MVSIITTIADSIAISLLDENALLTAIGNELHLHRATTVSAVTTTTATATATTITRLTTTTSTKIPPHRAHNEERLIEQQLKAQEQLSFGLRCKVHGIVPGSGINAQKLLVFGEKEYMLLAWQVPEYRFELLHRGHLSDWINAATFEADCQQFVLHTAHSVLLRFTYTYTGESNNAATGIGVGVGVGAGAGAGAKCSVTLLERASCTDKSTLYTAHLHGQSWQQLAVFGGNAFGELLIWQPRPAAATASPLLHRIPAHNGVIFSIDYNAQAQLLITTSDDRSIKFWRVESLAPHDETHDWHAAKLQAVVSGFAHVARVFCGRIIAHAGAFYAVTVGEDSYFCVWRTNGDLLHKRREHFGATIWNLDYDAQSKTLYTVGATGNVLAYGLQAVLEQPSQGIVTRALAAVDGTNEYVAKVKFLDVDLLIGVSNCNRLLCSSLKAAATSSWQPINGQHPSYKCTVLEVHDNLLAVCGYRRATLYEYVPASGRFNSCYDGPLLEGVIRAFHFLDANTYLVCDALGNCQLLRGKDFGVRSSLTLPAGREPWLTAALLLPGLLGGAVGGGTAADCLLASSRNGNMLLFKGTATEPPEYVLQQKLRQPHGYLGATVMRIVHATPDAIFIRSAARDGSVKLLHLCRRSTLLTIYAQHLVPVAWVEASLQLEQAELLLGFNDNRFVVWSRDHDFLLQHACGGGHRCWHYRLQWQPDSSSYGLQLVFIKHKQVFYHQMALFHVCRSKLTLRTRNHWHVRSCNALRICHASDASAPVIVSAGDDNLIKISKLTSGGRLLQLHELHTHISSVRCVHLKRLSAARYLIFSGGGRAQLCIARLELHDASNVGDVQELDSYTIRPQAELMACTQAYKPDAELRIMTLDVAVAPGSAYFIYLGCSDGYLRLLRWQPPAPMAPTAATAPASTYTQLHEVYFGRCLLQVRLLAPIVLVAATDGILHCYSWDLTLELLQLRMHDSGINALDALLVDGVLHMLTGGDDQAVAYAQVALEFGVSQTQPPTLSLQHKRTYRQLHTAQVTGVALRRTNKPPSGSRCDGTSTLYAYTCGIDQNLTVYDLGAESIVRSLHSCVADVKGLAMAPGGSHGFLYGCGLQVLAL